MRYRRSVWVLDVYDYLGFVSNALDTMIVQCPWLSDPTPINQHWHWKDASRVDLEKTQREALFDWIIAEEMSQVFYLTPKNHLRSSPEFELIHNRLVCEFDLNRISTSYFIIPKIYSDIHIGSVFRQGGWLYIECDIYEDNYKQHGIPTSAPTRYST